MSPNKSKSTRTRSLWEFRDELWGFLKIEAKQRRRGVARFLEDLLDERYQVGRRTDAEIAEAIRIANEDTDDDTARENIKEAEAMPRRGAKKRARR